MRSAFYRIKFFLLFGMMISLSLLIRGQNPTTGSNLEAFVPETWVVIKSASGDLNQDGREDLAAALEGPPIEPGSNNPESLSPSRRLIILFKQNNGYLQVFQSDTALLKADQGGVWGDPFADLTCDRGSIVISFFGGSRERWGFTLRFRFQDNGFFLIGLTKYLGDASTGKESQEDFNLLTGKKIITHTVQEKQISSVTENRGRKRLLNLANFIASEIETLDF